MRWCYALAIATGCGRIGFGSEPSGPVDAPSDGRFADASPAEAGNAACASNSEYTLLGGGLNHRYKQVPIDLSWPQARDACAADGAYLAIPDDASEAALLNGDWMGLTDDITEGQWLTVRGDPAPFLPWGAGEPTGGMTENCARLDDNSDLLEARSCADTRDYICECD